MQTNILITKLMHKHEFSNFDRRQPVATTQREKKSEILRVLLIAVLNIDYFLISDTLFLRK